MSVTSAKIKINGTNYNLTYNGVSGKWEATITAPGVTSYNQSGHYFACEVTATNSAGTSATVGVNDATVGNNLKLVVKETIAPVITIVSPTSGAYASNSQQPVVATVVDETNGSGIDLSTLVVKLDDVAQSSGISTSAIANGYTVTFTPAAMSDGSHTVSFDVKDHDGNSATRKSTTFTLDTVPPTLNIASPTVDFISSSATVGYSGTTNDATSSPVTIAVTLDGVAKSAPTVTNGSFSGSFAGVSEGSHTVVFTATDVAGKTTSVTRNFSVDTSVPAVTAVSISPNPADTGATMIVQVTIV